MKMEPWEWNVAGVRMATIAGVLGAAGALCVILALKTGGSPLVVAPLVFAGAPIVNALVSMAWHRPKSPPEALFLRRDRPRRGRRVPGARYRPS
jgi:hypothetical protein